MNMAPLMDFLEAIRIQYAIYAAIGTSVLTLLVCWTGPKGRRFIPRILFGAFLTFSASIFTAAFLFYLKLQQQYDQSYAYLEIFISTSVVAFLFLFSTLISKSIIERKLAGLAFFIVSIPLSIAMGGMVAIVFVILGKVYPLPS